MTHTPEPYPRSGHLVPPIALAMLLLLFVANTARAEIKVEKKPPVVEYNTFDPANPPAAMPKLAEGEEAITWTEFGCNAGLSVQMTQRVFPDKDRTVLTYRVQRVTTTLTLKIVVWLPEGASDKLKAHEEGHRKIAERAYEGAEAAAKAAAAKVDGRRVAGEGPSIDVAEKKANAQIAELNDKLAVAYREAISDAAQRTQDIYDELTDHGRKATPTEAEAITQAFQRQNVEAKEAAKRPATRPVTRPATAPAKPVALTTKPATRPAAPVKK